MKHLKYITLITQIGLDLISATLFGAFIGYLLDKLFKNENNIFLMIFMIVGLFSGFFNLYKNIMKIIENDKESD